MYSGDLGVWTMNKHLKEQIKPGKKTLSVRKKDFMKEIKGLLL